MAAPGNSNPKAVRPAVSLGQLLLRDGKIDEAVAALGAAVSRGPSDATAHAALGRALYLKLTERDTATEGEVRRAQAVLARALEFDPGDGRTPALLASLEMRPGGDVDRAAAFLAQAIKAGGSTLRDYAHTDGRLGRFQHRFKVYGREGKPCPSKNCAGKIRRIVQGGRTTFYCPTCQK